MSNQNILTNVKIIKRHSAPGVFIGVLCLFSIVIPAFLWIYPWFAVSIGGVTANGAAYQYQSGGVSLNMIHLMMQHSSHKIHEPIRSATYTLHQYDN